MPTFRITAPDGRVFRVTAPDGATREQALARVQAQYSAAPPDASARLRQSNPAEYDPTSPEFQARYGAAAVPGVENFLAGAGKATVDLGRGVRQLAAAGGETIGLVGRGTSDRLRAQQDDVSARDAALMGTGAGVAGAIAGTLATTIVPASVLARGAQAANLTRTAGAARAFASPTTYRASVGAGALQGALQPVGTTESRSTNVLTGAALGGVAQGAANVIGRIAQPIKRALSKQDEKAVRTLDKAGVPLDAAQRSGSKAAEVVKRAVGDNPLASPGQAAFIEKQRTAFTRAVLKTIGTDADAATEDVMAAAASRIGSKIGDIAERNPIPYDGKLHDNLTQVYEQAKRELAPDSARIINNQLADIFEKAAENGGKINGHAYRDIKAALDRISGQQGGVGHWAGELRNAVEEALQRSAKGVDFDELKNARLQYWRLSRILEALPTDGAGQISPAALANKLAATKSAKKSMHLGRGDRELVILAQSGKRLLPDKFPNSGTAARLMGQAAAPLALGIGSGAVSGDPLTGLGTAAGAAGLMLGARGALNNQAVARYLAEGMRAGRTRNILAAPQSAGLLGRQLPIVAIPALQE